MVSPPRVGINSTAVDDFSIFVKLLEGLKVALSGEIFIGKEEFLLLHMLRALSKTVVFMKTVLLCDMFWLAVVCVHITKLISFPEAYKLLSNIINELLNRHPNALIETVLLNHRIMDPELNGMLEKFESLAGISFVNSFCTNEANLDSTMCFTYSLSLTLISGISISAIRDDVVALIDKLSM